MPARFILSLDCEGKWGVADLLSAKIHAQLSDSGLRAGYRSIMTLLDEFEIPATFAFVGLFAETPGDFAQLRPELVAMANRYPGYLGAAIRDIEQGSGEGWHGSWAVDQLLGSKTRHELALHGVTHVPWDMMTSQDAQAELSLLRRLKSPVCQAKTFVYPRNKVAHVDLLGRTGLIGYRQSPPLTSRLMALLTEFDVLAGAECDPPLSHPQPIPAGHFVNWQSRARRIVPIELSTLRAARMLKNAEATDGIVHFWLHPENVVTAPRTLILLRKIIELVARARDLGRCEVITQVDYCRRLRLVAAAAAAE